MRNGDSVSRLVRLNILIPVAGPTGLYLALTSLVMANRLYLETHPDCPGLYESGVRYLRDADKGTQESPDAELWLTIPDCIAYGGADCKVLAAWRVAELQEQGEAAVPLLIEPRPGGRTWHVVVRRGDGSIEDPSKLLGMNGDA